MSNTLNSASNWNDVETSFKDRSHFNPSLSKEALPLVEVKNSEELGRLSALSFILWLEKNPKGVAVLPVGKSSLSFLAHLNRFVARWNDAETQEELRGLGVFIKDFPKTSELKLVQPFIFNPPLNKYQSMLYKNLLRISDNNVLSIDTVSIAPDKVENEFRTLYLNTLRQWGGIGFYLTEIGQDGHIGFNAPESKFRDVTQEYIPPYSTLAQIATDFGGIDNVRERTLLTVALGGFRTDATIIITGTGEGKAVAIKDAIEVREQSELPGSAIRNFTNLRFYATEGAISKLSYKRADYIRTKDPLDDHTVDDTLIDIALEKGSTC